MSLLRDYNGESGPFWQKDAAEQLKGFIEDLKNKDMIIKNNVVRWSNGNIVPYDIIELLLGTGIINQEQFNTTKEAMNDYMTNMIANHANRKLTSEEVSEMKANFDEGTVMINVLTGEKYIIK